MQPCLTPPPYILNQCDVSPAIVTASGCSLYNFTINWFVCDICRGERSSHGYALSVKMFVCNNNK